MLANVNKTSVFLHNLSDSFDYGKSRKRDKILWQKFHDGKYNLNYKYRIYQSKSMAKTSTNTHLKVSTRSKAIKGYKNYFPFFYQGYFSEKLLPYQMNMV